MKYEMKFRKFQVGYNSNSLTTLQRKLTKIVNSKRVIWSTIWDCEYDVTPKSKIGHVSELIKMSFKKLKSRATPETYSDTTRLQQASAVLLPFLHHSSKISNE